MPQQWIWLIIAFVLFDVCIGVLVVRKAFQAFGLLGALGGTMAERKAVLSAAQELTSSTIDSAWNGDPETLPGVVTGLAPRMESLLRSHGLEPVPGVVRALLRGTMLRKRLPLPHVDRALATLGRAG